MNRRVAQAVRSWAVQLIPQRGPARQLCLLTAVQSASLGLFLSSSAIFFRHTVGLSVSQVALGLSAAGLAGLTMTVPVGRLVDRFGSRVPLLGCYTGMAVLFAAYWAAEDFLSFVVLASLISMCQASSNPPRKALVRAAFSAEQRVRASAQMRSLSNLGFMIGAAMAGAALAVGTRSAFCAVSLLSAAGCAGCALVTLGLPCQERSSALRAAAGRTRRSALRDYRFVLLSLLCGTLELYQQILTVGLPLWIISRTHVGPAINSLLLMLDALLVIVFQVAASRGAETTPGAARKLRRAGLLLAVACLVFALSQSVAAVIAIPLLLAGTTFLVLGELNQASGSWGLSLHLPPPGRQGEYQGVFALGRGLQESAGPFLITTLVVGQGRAGWVTLAAILLVAGLACTPLARAAEASRAVRVPSFETAS